MWVSDLHFMVQRFCLISWRLFDGLMYWRYSVWFKCHNCNIGSMWCKDQPHKMYVGQWPTLRGPVILTYLEKTFWWRNVVLKIFSVTLSLTYNCICRSVTYILWYSDSALYFQYYLMNKPRSLDICSDMGHWPVISWLWIIYLFLPIVVWWSLIWKSLWSSKVRIRPVAGASVYFGHISSSGSLLKKSTVS